MVDDDSINLKIRELEVKFIRNSMFEEFMRLKEAIKSQDREEIHTILKRNYYLLWLLTCGKICSKLDIKEVKEVAC